MKRLPIYILIDTSGSMRGEPIDAVKAGLQSLFSTLGIDPKIKDTAHVCVITFDRVAKVLLPLTKLDKLKLPAIPPLESSPTNLGEALELMCSLYKKEVKVSDEADKGDYLPLAVVMTDGSPSDTALFNHMCEVLSAATFPFARIISCAAGPKAKTEPLKRFSTDVVSLKTMDTSGFISFWQWISDSFIQHNQDAEDDLDDDLPPPPVAVNLVF
jgi:uncharacterized protein YegL